MTAQTRTHRKSVLTRVEKEQRRLKAAERFAEGARPAQVARELKVSRQAATRWRAQWKELGKQGLRSTGSPGVVPRLSPRQKAQLARDLVKGPLAHGFKTELWTLERIAQHIKRRFGVGFSTGHIWYVLRALGFTAQKPTTQARERDAAKVEAWMRRDWPRIKKNSGGSGPHS